MKIFKFAKEKPKIVLIQGSPRAKNSCPDMDSKTSKIITHILTEFKDKANFDVLDLSVEADKPIIQPCKACYSTAGGYHCHYPCDCYKKNSDTSPDLLHNEDMYKILEECDAFAVITPIHWYSVPTQVKALFDRLICVNLTLTTKDATSILGKDIKNESKTGPLNISKKYEELLKNHWSGKFAAFFAHGDNGADDYSEKDLPESFNPKDETSKTQNTNDPKQAVMPLVLQCRYSGIFVPENCIIGIHTNKNMSYYQANSEKNDELKNQIKILINNLLENL